MRIFTAVHKKWEEKSSVFMHVLKRKMQQHTQAWPYQFLWKPFFPWNHIIVSGQLGKNEWFYETSQYIKKIFCPFDTDFHDMLKMFIVPSTTWFYCQQYNLYLKEYKFCMMYCPIILRIWIFQISLWYNCISFYFSLLSC